MPLLLVVGYGPGNSYATARRFGKAGWTIALVGRTESKLRQGIDSLAEDGISAHAFVGDASDVTTMRDTVRAVQESLGPITSIVFSAYRPVEIGDVLTDDPNTVNQVFMIGIGGMLTVVQAALDDLRNADQAAVLVLNGGLGIQDPSIDSAAISFGGDGVALECAAKSKLVGLLSERLRPEEIYVGELIINGTVKGSPYAGPTALDPAVIADRLWQMAEDRAENHVQIAELG